MLQQLISALDNRGSKELVKLCSGLKVIITRYAVGDPLTKEQAKGLNISLDPKGIPRFLPKDYKLLLFQRDKEAVQSMLTILELKDLNEEPIKPNIATIINPSEANVSIAQAEQLLLGAKDIYGSVTGGRPIKRAIVRAFLKQIFGPIRLWITRTLHKHS